MFDDALLLSQNWPFSPPNHMTLQITLFITKTQCFKKLFVVGIELSVWNRISNFLMFRRFK